MKTLVKVAIPICLVTAGYAESWKAKLLDSACADKNAPATQTSTKKSRESLAKSCAPTASTANYSIETSDGRIYKLDTAGNAKVASEMQSGAIKPDKDGDVHVTVAGTLQGDTVKVDSVGGHGEGRK